MNQSYKSQREVEGAKALSSALPNLAYQANPVTQTSYPSLNSYSGHLENRYVNVVSPKVQLLP